MPFMRSKIKDEEEEKNQLICKICNKKQIIICVWEKKNKFDHFNV